jgi:hypothetical protein
VIRELFTFTQLRLFAVPVILNAAGFRAADARQVGKAERTLDGQ